ncbi:hypothetical protein JD844_006348 [Phrynosoma platyrhinos]|uniref:RNA helicase n=1 Tax=Phrynosoma platyrhinos TaxID=52577 RepID=A0ABQ7T1B7_PHRPL|nr:hypothetical protein JD844_006348 [Phrynosoma platyrhinos]
MGWWCRFLKSQQPRKALKALETRGLQWWALLSLSRHGNAWAYCRQGLTASSFSSLSHAPPPLLLRLLPSSFVSAAAGAESFPFRPASGASSSRLCHRLSGPESQEMPAAPRPEPPSEDQEEEMEPESPMGPETEAQEEGSSRGKKPKKDKKDKSKKQKLKKHKSQPEENGQSDSELEPPKPKKIKKKKEMVDDIETVIAEYETTSPVHNGVDHLKKQSNAEESNTDCESDQDPELTEEQKEGDFSNFDISKSTVDLLKARGVTYLFPVQAKTFKYIYDGKDVIAQARTGTGKTFSFALPLIEKLQRDSQERKRGRTPKVLVLTPTRELAMQVAKDFKDVTKKLTVAFDLIRNGIDILVGTPGRIKDHLQNGKLDISSLKHVVLDEVDQMLDMGFAEQVEEILAYSYKKGKYILCHLAIECHWSQRAAVIGDVLQVYSGSHGRTIIFCETKKEATELALNASIKQDVESYIHRSGRTGRAGRTGICICFYQRKEDYQLKQVEQKAGITFKRVGVPTATDIIKASSKDAIKSLDSVPPSAIDYFRQSAERLIEEKGAVEALAAALAHISGATSIEQRSLLNSDAGYVTMRLQCSVEMHSIGYAWRGLKEQLGEDIDNKVFRMRFLKGKTGVCFDIPVAELSKMQQTWQDTRRWQLSVATELPELEESPNEGGRGGGGGSDFRNGRRGGGGGSDFRNGRRGGGSNFRNGRRGGSSNRNDRSRNRGQKRSFDRAF